MQLLICAGGTGGGVYPALSILQTLKHNQETSRPESGTEEKIEVLWVGSRQGLEADLVRRAGIAFEAIPAAGVHGVGVLALPGNLLQLVRGFFASLSILRRFRPDVLFFTGGYVAIPMALAARSFLLSGKKPGIVLYVPDIEPGLALKTLARFADRIAVTADESRGYFSPRANVIVSGYPVRPDLYAKEKVEARRALGLRTDLPLLLVFGGSLGARSINRALYPALPELLEITQILHLSGNLDWAEAQEEARFLAEKWPQLGERYRVHPYLHEEMTDALCAADLTVCRAGASTLGELPVAGLPALLVPYPYAWRYQRVNAEYLERHGAAVMVDNANLPERIGILVREIMTDTDRLERMRAAMRSLSAPQGAETILEQMREIRRERLERRT